ncbi:MAG: hypothetical protein IH827_05580 [Myxococcales bacterium]|nr:hypothetical protein [Myxococcales bacterium]
MDRQEPLDRFDPEERYARARLAAITKEQGHTLSALARLIGWTALPLPALALWYSELYRVGGTWLGEWLPPFLVSAIGVTYALATASWLALIYGSLPIVAHRVAARPARRLEIRR